MGASRIRNSFDRTGFALKLSESGFGGGGNQPLPPASDGPEFNTEEAGAHQVIGYNDLFVMYICGYRSSARIIAKSCKVFPLKRSSSNKYKTRFHSEKKNLLNFPLHRFEIVLNKVRMSALGCQNMRSFCDPSQNI